MYQLFIIEHNINGDSMLSNNNYYKSSDITNNDYINRMNTYFNPYEYNLESNNKNMQNSDLINIKSKLHNERKRRKK